MNTNVRNTTQQTSDNNRPLTPPLSSLSEVLLHAQVSHAPKLLGHRSQGEKLIDSVAWQIQVAPLTSSRKGSVRRQVHGYRMTVSSDWQLPLRLSFMHSGLKGSWLINWVNNRKKMSLVSDVVMDLYGYQVWSFDAPWAQRLLKNNQFSILICQLLACSEQDAEIGHPCLMINPNSIQYYRRSKSIDGLRCLKSDLHALQQIRNLLEEQYRQQAPVKPAKLSWFERAAVKNPIFVGALFVLLILIVPILIFGGLFVLLTI